MVEELRNERDLILSPNEYALVSDATKGSIDCYVGPFKTSLAGTDKCVLFDNKTKRFRPVSMQEGTQLFYTAPEGYYIILKNVAEAGKNPSGSGKLSTPTLRVGKKVNIPGPASFALWPGQMAKVIEGHKLRSNEYLLVQVYDEEAARANWDSAVIKTQVAETGTSDIANAGTAPLAQRHHGVGPLTRATDTKKPTLDIPTADELVMGKLFVIRGTEVSFYIPPTGVEIVTEKWEGGERYVREAVTLERLEYCLLLDQNGTKRYVHGPDVVFPRPTEKFVEAGIKSNPDKAKAKKFRAQELTPASGIHIRVIADYTEEPVGGAPGVKRTAGDELFITGSDQTIYYPREEHAIIKYGEQEIYYGIAIPVGEARYVLDRDSGVISLVKGPQIFLPDPRTQVIINRALPLNLVELMYPGNQEAIAVNATRLNVNTDSGLEGDAIYAAIALNSNDGGYAASAAAGIGDTNKRVMIRGASKALPGDAFDRKNKHTAPRSIVLNTKFDGAVSSDIWTGYAMLLVRKSGERRVVQGPLNVMMEYDESPQVMSLSRGKPKTTDSLLRTVYLLTRANKVADIINIETRDFIKLDVKLSYRVNFEGEPETWFNVDNYVKFLCDHMRSRVRASIQKLGIEEFYNNHTDIIRDVVLGAAIKGEKRAGTLFEENGMRIYDVEVLDVKILNPDIEQLLIKSQKSTIQNALLIADEKRKLDYVNSIESLKQDTQRAQAETLKVALGLQSNAAKMQLECDLITISAKAESEAKEHARRLATEQANGEITSARLEIEMQAAEAHLELEKEQQAQRLAVIQAEVQAVVDKAKAISPDLIAALSIFGERAMVEKVAEAMAPMSILGGKDGGSVIDILKKLLEGTNLAKQLSPGLLTNGNGKAKTTTSPSA